MKKHLIKFISVVLIFILSAFTLSSCGLYFSTSIFKYPKGYTGGFGSRHPMSSVEYAWVETYEEVEEAIELLSSHGSNFYKSAFFNYEGDLFDTKYCFKFLGKKDNIKYGEDPFDRYAEEVYIYSYAFFEDVTIEELVYSSISRYDVLYFYPHSDFLKYYQTNNNLKKLFKKNLTYRGNLESGNISILCENVSSYDKLLLFLVYREKWNTELRESVYYEISEEALNAILDSIIVFGEYYQ